MKVFLVSYLGVPSLQIQGETEAECQYLEDLDTRNLLPRLTKHLNGEITLNLKPSRCAVDARENFARSKENGRAQTRPAQNTDLKPKSDPRDKESE